ncbi:Zinc finger, CCCH-type [Corchorus olitorius]|uniref:Zinc finger, CCCH-type n=1 Tax=Corchorus olitorius TaxID=93759 RepID=A0A1R3J9Z2_9ROSI|nr:Zinc finger, CCCH-type [Corchorus olitorius]
MAPPRILLCGDVLGRLNQLFKRVNSVNKSAGPFDALFCVGQFFPDETDRLDEFMDHVEGRAQIPLPTYFIGDYGVGAAKVLSTASKNSANQGFKMDGFKICDNLFWLKGSGKFTLHGTKGAFYAREPYSNVDAMHVTRFLGLASVGNKDKQKFLHALSPTPSSAMSAAEISAKPPNTTLSPYTLADQADHPKESTKRAGDSLPDSQYWRYDVSNKRQKHGSGDGNKVCFKFISSGNCPRGEKCNFQHDVDAREQFLRGVCLDFIIKGKCEKGPDCNFKHSLQDEGESYTRRRPGSGNSNTNRSKECWFCLSSPNVDSHLVISIGENFYCALAKGPLVQDHALIIPVEHLPNTLCLPEDSEIELGKYRNSLKMYYKNQGKDAVFFEWISVRSTHANLQAIPVPSSKTAALKDIFDLAAKKLGFEFVSKKFNNNSEGRKWLRTQFDKNLSCFYVELPDGSILLHVIEENEKFPAQFGREVLAGLLNMADRADWRNCTPGKEEETMLAENFKKRFQVFDPRHNASPSPTEFSMVAPSEGIPDTFEQRSNPPTTPSLANGSGLHPSPALPPLMSAPVPESTEGHGHSLSPSDVTEPPAHNTAPPPFTIEERGPSLPPGASVVSPPVGGAPPPLPDAPSKSPTAPHEKAPIIPSITPSQNPPESSPVIHHTPVAPSLNNSPQNPPDINSSSPSAFPPIANQRNSSNDKAPVLEPTAPAPVGPPLRNSPQNPPSINSSRPSASPPSANQRNSSNSRAPIMEPIAPAPVITPSRNSPQNHTAIHSRGPTASPPSAPIPEPIAPVASPPMKFERATPPDRSSMPPSVLPVPVISPSGDSPQNSPTVHPNMPGGTPSQLPAPGISPVASPPSSINWKNDGIPAASPINEIHKPVPPVNHTLKNGSSSAVSPAPKAPRHPASSPVPSLAPSNKGKNHSALSPSSSLNKHQHKRNQSTTPAPEPIHSGSSASPPQSVVPSSVNTVAPVPSPSPVPASRQTKLPLISPKVSPSKPPLRGNKVPPPPLVMSFPPPPPNDDCSTTICTEPYTNTPPGSPCDCVLPMQVGLRLSVALYTFFPLVSELAAEIAAGVFMKQSQVRIIGANAASEQPEKTLVLTDLVPLGKRFDNTTAFLTFQRFWHKQVAIKTSLFGDYEVLYVRYLGLPPSPPLPPSDVGLIDGGPYPGNGNNARAIKPLGVDVHGKRHRSVLSGGVIAIIVLSVLVALVLCSAIAWALLYKRRGQAGQRGPTPQPLLPSLAKPSGSAGSMVGSGLSSTSLSFSSSIAAYTGSAKTFSASDIEKATGNFDDARILGEGGFGRVYSGVLEDDTKVAVKVLKRDDQQGGREFLAEVEMLSRLHHRNLVKLIGICTEERVDKEAAPLEWDTRIKIALGAARGLAYLHEDSSPRVIHRDFKSSNILLEHDFTPKVSDFGLARTAMDEEGRHISTRVMGTFGYVAPEYAMTGHLLVKSDVYSYGVVLLELLTGRKPVDMTQPPGQENLVAWARPLLTTKEGLEAIIDPSLGADVPFDSFAKVAAIASMCVQPEVSHRPFMGEVVQALKLVCNECDEAKEVGSGDFSQDDLSVDLDARVSTHSGQLTDPLQSHYLNPNYDSGLDTERGLSVSDLFSSSARYGRQSSESFRRHFSSGPLRTERGTRFWQKMQRMSRGSISEHGVMNKFWSGSH